MRKYDYDFLIDGNPILIADEGVQITEKDIVQSGTDESGIKRRDVIREGVLTISIPYSRLTREEYNYIRSLIKGKAFFSVTLLDLDGQVRTITAYCEKIPISLYNKTLGVYKKLTITITEC